MWRMTKNNSHPLDPVGRVLLDKVDAVQDVGDVVDSAFAGAQVDGDVPQVHGAVWSCHQQLEETAGQEPQRHI